MSRLGLDLDRLESGEAGEVGAWGALRVDSIDVEAIRADAALVARYAKGSNTAEHRVATVHVPALLAAVDRLTRERDALRVETEGQRSELVSAWGEVEDLRAAVEEARGHLEKWQHQAGGARRRREMAVKFIPSKSDPNDGAAAFILRKPGSRRAGLFDVQLSTCVSGPVLIVSKVPPHLADLIGEGRRGALMPDPQGKWTIDPLLVAAVKLVYPDARWGRSRRKHETTTRSGRRETAPFFMAYVGGKVVAAVAPLAQACVAHAGLHADERHGS